MSCDFFDSAQHERPMPDPARNPFASQRLRRITGWTLVVVGIPLYILPLPLGLPVIVPGILLVISGSPSMRRRFVRLRNVFPAIYAKFKMFRKRRAASRRARRT